MLPCLASALDSSITILPPHPIYCCKVHVRLHPSATAPGFVTTGTALRCNAGTYTLPALPSHKANLILLIDHLQLRLRVSKQMIRITDQFLTAAPILRTTIAACSTAFARRLDVILALQSALNS